MSEMVSRLADILINHGCGNSEECEKTVRVLLASLDPPTEAMLTAAQQTDGIRLVNSMIAFCDNHGVRLPKPGPEGSPLEQAWRAMVTQAAQ